MRHTLALLASILALLVPSVAGAQGCNGQSACGPYGYYPAAVYAIAPRPYTPAPAPPADPYGFTAWLNGQRAARGLGPVAWDAGLAGWAAANSARGFGHNVLNGQFSQCVGMGSYQQVCWMWLADPPHAAILLNPSIRRAGLAVVNGVWTVDVN